MPTAVQDCPGACNGQARRALERYKQLLHIYDADYQRYVDGVLDEEPFPPDSPDVRLRPGEPIWCPRCKALIHAALLDLDNLAAELQALSDGHRGSVPEGRVSGSRTARSPSPNADTLDRLYGWLADVEDEWRDTWGYGKRTDRIHRGAHPRSRRITWLAERLEGILSAQEHIEFGLGVLKWEVTLRERLREDSVGTRSPIRCPRCSERRVVRQKEGYWSCGACTMLISNPYERKLRHDQGCELVQAEQMEARAS